MDKKRVNTAAADLWSYKIEETAQHMMRDYQTSINKVQGLKSCWQGEAATTGIEKYTNLVNNRSSCINDVLKAYCTFLENIFSAGYTATEDLVKKKKELI